VYVKYSAKAEFSEIDIRNRAKAGRERINRSDGVSDVVTGPKTFSLNNAYVDASTAVTCGRRPLSFV